MTPRRFAFLQGVLARRQPDLTVFMENVHKPHNLAAIIRTCDAVGVLRAHAVSVSNKIRLTQEAAGGSGKWVRIRHHPSTPEALRQLRAEGLQLIAAHPGTSAKDFREVDFTRPTAIVLGQEKYGLTPETLENVDTCITVPMAGMVESLNVSVATAVILFEAQRQRRAAGLYDSCRLDPETYRRLLFEWCYPRVADLHRRNGTPYPPLDKEGFLPETGRKA